MAVQYTGHVIQKETHDNNNAMLLVGVLSGVNKGGYWGYLPPPRILGVNTPP